MKNNKKLILVLFLITWVLFGAVTLINYGHQYIGKSFFKSDSFVSNVYSFKNGIGRYILQPFDAEEAIKNITVSQEEIDEHRYYYGSLPEQIESIQMQYEDRIHEADTAGNTVLKTQLEAERDAKIADIQENFKNDAHVEAKIRKEKEEAIKSFAANEEKQRIDFINEYHYFQYHLTNVETKETFESKNVSPTTIYKEKFDGEVNSYLISDNHFSIDEEYTNTFVENYHLSGDTVTNVTTVEPFEIENKVSRFEGTISIPKSALNHTDFKSEYNAFITAKTIFYVIWVSAILAIVGLFTFAKPSLSLFEGSNQLKTIVNKWPIDVRIVFVLILALIGVGLIDVSGNMIRSIALFEQYTRVQQAIEAIILMIFMFAIFSAAIVGTMWIWLTINTEQKLKDEIKRAFLYRIADGIQDLFLNRSIGVQSLAILIIAFLAGFGFLPALGGHDETIIIYILLAFFVGLPACLIFLRRMGYLNRIMKQTKEMAEGRLTSEIKVKGKSPFAKHAANLNALREGVRKSMSEQAKSERLKTELITNVSHDLRTPLTSIITYTDLLKNPDITEEERAQYIDVLDKKSARLKTLIEDLFEVSKMASGNIEISKQRVDLTQLLLQATGEHEEAFENANLELRVTVPEVPIFAYVDGQKWWRVIDNLILNALKYSMKGTRVYVSLKQNGTEAEFTVKNVSSYELCENVEELTERFKRADASRHTDGSGLGLAIAQSIVDLHNGRMAIEVDGDLFKVTVSINVI